MVETKPEVVCRTPVADPMVAVPVTTSFVVVAFVNVALVATSVVAVRSLMVASAERMAADTVPEIDAPEIVPPLMVGLVMVVLERLPMFWLAAKVAMETGALGPETGMTRLPMEAICIDNLFSSVASCVVYQLLACALLVIIFSTTRSRMGLVMF